MTSMVYFTVLRIKTVWINTTFWLCTNIVFTSCTIWAFIIYSTSSTGPINADSSWTIIISTAFWFITHMVDTFSTSTTIHSIPASLMAITFTSIRKITILIRITMSIQFAVGNAFEPIDTFLPNFTLACNILICAIDQLRVIADRSIWVLNRYVKVKASSNHRSTFEQAISQIWFAYPKSAAVVDMLNEDRFSSFCVDKVSTCRRRGVMLKTPSFILAI